MKHLIKSFGEMKLMMKFCLCFHKIIELWNLFSLAPVGNYFSVLFQGIIYVFSFNMVATGQEIVREKKILQGQGKVREFHFESGKIYIFEKSQGKVKF